MINRYLRTTVCEYLGTSYYLEIRLILCNNIRQKLRIDSTGKNMYKQKVTTVDRSYSTEQKDVVLVLIYDITIDYSEKFNLNFLDE